MDKLFTLLALQRQAQEAGTLDSFSHVVTNQTLKIVPYKQAVFWIAEGRSITLKSVSGNANLDQSSSYAFSLKKIIENQIFAVGREQENQHALSLSVEKNAGQKDGLKSPGALMIFETPREGIIGGVYLEREQEFQEAELQILSELSVSYAYSLATIKLRDQALSGLVWQKVKQAKLYILGAVLMAMLLPVRLSVTAPAEIVPEDPFVISAPFDGTLKEMLVRPGESVDEGQIVAEMDEIILGNKMETVSQEMQVAEGRLSRLRRESLANPEKKAELKKLESDIDARLIEYEYTEEMLERSSVTSPVKGVAIFSDKNALQGKPIRLGEKIMMIADPNKKELLVRVPVDAMIPLNREVKIKYFLNVSPLSGHKAEIRDIGYQASLDPDGLLTYKIRGSLGDKHEDIRVGWKGTAKIYGDRTILGYAILRRPLITLRNFLGV